MDVAPHPHIGLQTVSWLLQGEIVHNDSLGSEALLRPGGVNVMTSGSGIAHSEETPPRNSGVLRFGEVKAYRGPRLNAPPLQRFAPPNPAS